MIKAIFEPNPQNAYTLNNLTTKTDADGSNRFVAPSLGRKRPIGRCTAAGSVGRGVVRPGSKRYRAAQPDCLPTLRQRAFFGPLDPLGFAR